MKKQDFKKLALMGLSGGLMIAAQPLSADLPEGTNNEGGILLAHGCGAHSCNGSTPPPGSSGRQGCGAQQGPRGSSCNAQTSGGGHGCQSRSGCASCKSTSSARGYGQIAEGDNAAAVTNPGRLSESDLVNKLDAEGKATYQGLDAEGKALALQLANQACKGQNNCAGLSACKSADHACAGQNSCQGKGTCAFKNKNDAVKVAAMKMAQKRANAGK